MFQTTLDPETQETVTLILYKNVTNTQEIREAVISGQMKCCVIKPSLILDPFQVVVATNKAVLSHMRNKMNTRTVFSEILFNLSITKNISQSLVKFGIEDSEKNMLVCLLTKETDGSVDHVMSQIKGEQRPIEELATLRDENLIKETYKIRDCELQVSCLLDSVVSRIATKDIVSVTN